MAIMRRLLVLMLLVPCAANATKIVSQQTGNWGDGSTWVGGVVPGNGDEVSLFHTISDTDTRTVGVSVTTGSIAINFNSTGTIHVTSTGHIVARGYTQYTAGASNLTDAVDVDGGGAWEFDASQSTSPTTIHYGFFPSGSSGFRKFKVSGSSSAYASLYNTVTSTTAAITENGQTSGGVYELLYASVTRMTFDLAFNNGGSQPVKWDAQHSSFTSCGLITITGTMESSATFRHEYNYHQSSLGPTIFTMNMSSKKEALGTRSFKGNIFDIKMSPNLGMGDFTIRDNFMGAGYDAGIASFSLFTNNFVRMTQANITMGADGAMSDSYIWWDEDRQNPHVFTTSISSNVSMTGMIWGQSGRARSSGADDSGEFWLQTGPGLVSTMSITNSIFLANAAGFQSLEITSLLGTASTPTFSNNRFDCEHNTYFGGWNNGNLSLPPFAALDYSETSNMAPGTVDSFRSNLLWNAMVSTMPAQFFKVLDVGNASSNLAVGFGTGPTQDVCAPSRCDYNAGYIALSTATGTNTATYTNQGDGYGGKFSSTPGVHDVNGQNPNFVDYKRYVEAFDSKYYRPYFGLSQPSAWSSGATYNQGDIVSQSSSTYYWGDTLNYVYIDTGSCSGTNPQPGGIPTATWNKCWKSQSIEDIKRAIISSTTFTDAAIGASNSNVNQTLIKWIRAGYSPTNVAYHNTAHDGADIGAVAYSAAVSTTPHLTGAWFSTSEKMARQDLWPYGSCSTCTRTTNWDNHRAYMFGGKGEILHGLFYLQDGSALDATNVNVHISSFTDNAGHFIIPLTVSSSTVWDSNAAGPVNLFYMRYLQIHGETQESWDATEIDTRDLPPLFRVPCTITDPNRCQPTAATQYWWNRQDHDKFYPEIEIPYEAVQASSFTVAASSSQAIAMDVYIDTNTFIPSNASFNVFYATMSIYEGAILSTAMPITLKVYNFTMPVRPGLPVVAAVGDTHIDWFHSGSSSTTPSLLKTTREHYYQYLWRNRIIPIGDSLTDLAPNPNQDLPSPEYAEQLDGSLYTPARGFGNSPAVSTGVPFYMIGTYASWQNTVHFSSVTVTGGSGAFCTNVSSWSKNMGIYPGVRSELYLYDEPASSSAIVNDAERVANIMASSCAMSGAHINSWMTTSWVDIKSSAPHINTPVTNQWAQFSHNQTDWPLAQAYYAAGNPDGYGSPWMYNGHPPASGTMFATEDTGQSAEIFGPSAFKKGVGGMFLWEIVNWDTHYDVLGEQPNDIFNSAVTFGSYVTYASFTVTGMSSNPNCDYIDNNGFQYLMNFPILAGSAPNIGGTIVALSTWTASSFNPTSPSGTLTRVDNTCNGQPCTCTGDATVSYSSWSKTFVHPVRGYSGFNFANGDGVLLYPGHDVLDPAHDYGIDGPMGGFRFKMVRNGINMYDYATMAAAVNVTSATAIVNTIIPTILYEYQPVTNHGYYWGGRQWSDDPQVWESNRELLAQLIAAPSSSTITSSLTASATNGLSFSYQITASNSPQSYSATGLPAGLSLNVTTGLISGIPTEFTYGVFNVTLTATNSLGAGFSSTLVITVNRIQLPWKMRFR